MKKQPIVLTLTDESSNLGYSTKYKKGVLNRTDTSIAGKEREKDYASFGDYFERNEYKKGAEAFAKQIQTHKIESNNSFDLLHIPDGNLQTISSPYLRPKSHNNEMLAFISQAQKENNPIIMPFSLLPYYTKQENKHLLVQLYKSGVDIEFSNGHRKFDRDDIEVILRFVTELSEQKKNINKPKKRTKNVFVGNPDLNSQENIELNNRKKTQKALFDENNIRARKQVVLCKMQNLNYSKIASILNSKGLLTSHGKAFHPKQITRLWETYLELLKFYAPHPNEDRILRKTNNDLLELPVDHIEVVDENNLIVIHFKHPIADLIEVRIEDNQDNLVYYWKFQSVELDTIKIDILEQTTILPGKNYLFLRSLNYREHKKVLTIRPDFKVVEDSNTLSLAVPITQAL